MYRIQDVFKNCKEYILTCGSFLSALWSSTKFRGLLVFSFLLLMLPVVVISALKVTKYQEHADTIPEIQSIDGNFSIDSTDMSSAYSVDQPINVDVTLSTTLQENIQISLFCSILSAPGLSYPTQKLVGGPVQVDVKKELTSVSTIGTLSVSSESLAGAYPGKSSGQFFLDCEANEQFADGTSQIINFAGGGKYTDLSGNTDIKDFTISKKGSGTPPTPSPSCPLPSDARTYFSGNQCDSSSGLGFNTAGGKFSCGPVACPGQKSSLPHGNTCIYSEIKGGKTVCFAGYGDTGDVAGFDPSGCHYNPADNDQPISCPSSMKFTLHVDGLIAGAPESVSVNDNGRSHIYQTDPSGTITIQSYSGDKVVLTPQASTPYASIFPTAITTTVNTSWGCGTSGVSKSPCTFIAATNSSPSPTPPVTPTPTKCVQTAACAQPPVGCFWQKTDGTCGCGTLVCSSQTPTPTPIVSPSCQKTCPALPETCHYTSDATCCIPQGDGSCSCPGFVCE